MGELSFMVKDYLFHFLQLNPAGCFNFFLIDYLGIYFRCFQLTVAQQL